MTILRECKRILNKFYEGIQKASKRTKMLLISGVFLVLLCVMLVWTGSNTIGTGLNSKKYKKAQVTVTQTIISAETETEEDETEETQSQKVVSEWLLTYDGKVWKEKNSEGEIEEYTSEYSLFDFSMFNGIEKADLKKTKDGYVPKFGKEGIFFDIIQTREEERYSNFTISFCFSWGRIREIEAVYDYNGNYHVVQTYRFDY